MKGLLLFLCLVGTAFASYCGEDGKCCSDCIWLTNNRTASTRCMRYATNKVFFGTSVPSKSVHTDIPIIPLFTADEIEACFVNVDSSFVGLSSALVGGKSLASVAAEGVPVSLVAKASNVPTRYEGTTLLADPDRSTVISGINTACQRQNILVSSFPEDGVAAYEFNFYDETKPVERRSYFIDVKVRADTSRNSALLSTNSTLRLHVYNFDAAAISTYNTGAYDPNYTDLWFDIWMQFKYELTPVSNIKLGIEQATPFCLPTCPDNTRGDGMGCLGFGQCPRDSQGNICGPAGPGACMPNGKCRCPFSYRVGATATVSDTFEFRSLNYIDFSVGEACQYSYSQVIDYSPIAAFTSPACVTPGVDNLLTSFDDPNTFCLPLSASAIGYPSSSAYFGYPVAYTQATPPAVITSPNITDPCALNPCSSSGYCTTLDGVTPTCTCYEGFRGGPKDLAFVPLYSRLFMCGDEGSSAYKLSAMFKKSTYDRLDICSLDNPVLAFFVTWNQCLFFMPDSPAQKRYLRFSGLANRQQVFAPVFYRSKADPLLAYSSGQNPGFVTNQTITRGYNCFDGRAGNSAGGRVTGGDGVLYGGPDCLPCPSCVTANSMCVSDNSTDTTSNRVCSCYTNWAHSDNSNPICDKAICPWIGTGAPCGADTGRGICLYDPKGRNVPYNSSYISRCQCYDGFGGAGCERQICGPFPPPGGDLTGLSICSGDSVNNAPPNNYTQGGRGFCNETLGTCQCQNGWLNGDLNICELRACPIAPNGLECNGLVIYGSGAGYSPMRSVCDRSGPNPVCRCSKAQSTQGILGTDLSLSFYGTSCNISYAEACVDKSTGLFCGGPNGCTVPDPDNNPTGAPQCQCDRATQGPYSKYCNTSACAPNLPSLQACNIGNNSFPTGACEYRSQEEGAKCYCRTVDLANGFRECNAAYHPATCAIMRNDFGRCETSLLNCTYFSNNEFTLCNGLKDACKLNSQGQYACDCSAYPAYSGDRCQILDRCGGLCRPPAGQCNTYDSGATYRCDCDNYHSGPNCQTLTCDGTLNTTASGEMTCSCAKYGPLSTYYPPPSVKGATIKGCMKRCPEFNGIECGSLDINRRTRCNSTLTLATSPIGVACDCNILDPQGQRYIRSSNGACEPYCKNGGIWVGNCDCSRTSYSGVRCEVATCSNGGSFNVTTSKCVCRNTLQNPEFPFTSASLCVNSSCATAGAGYYTNGRGWCDCYPPYMASNDTTNPLCINPCGINGRPDTRLKKCVCTSPYFGGAYCDEPKCNPSPIKSSSYPISLAQLLFTTTTFDWSGGTRYTLPLSLYSSIPCECPNNGVWNGTDCIWPPCVNGINQGKGICKCDPLWAGPTCATDTCRQHNGIAVTQGSRLWQCQCNPGYRIDTTTGFCDTNLCVAGRPVPCVAGECQFSNVPYDCDCNTGATFSPNGYCEPKNCMHGVAQRGTDGAYRCVCDDGWRVNTISGICNARICDPVNRVFYNTTTQACQCIVPFNGTGCTQHLCGFGSSGPVLQNGQYVCNCLANYVLAPTVLPNQARPCVLNCSFYGTSAIAPTSCICAHGYTGTLCDIMVPIPLVPDTIDETGSSSSSSLTWWEIMLIVIGALAGVGLTFAVYEYYYVHREGGKPRYSLLSTTSSQSK